MQLSDLLLATTLIMWGITLLGWLTVSATVLGIFAFITGILFVLEALGIITIQTRTFHSKN